MKRIIGSLFAILIATVSLSGQGSVCNQTSTINFSSATTTIQIAAPTTGSIYVCGFSLSAGDGIRSITGSNPAAGAEVSETVPASARWNLLLFRDQLVTSAVVANRIPQLTIDDGTNTLLIIPPAAGTQAASTSFSYHWGNLGYGSNATNNGVQIGIPSLVLGAGYRIRTLTSALDVGDDYAAPQYLIQEWTVTQLIYGTGAACGTGTQNLVGIYNIQPADTINVFGTSPVLIVPAGNALCVANYRPTNLAGTISYTVK